MGAPSKRAKRTRSGSEFDVARLQRALAVPKGTGVPLTSWTLADIFAARDAQMRGQFNRPAKMSEAMRTDDALAVPLRSRLAPQQCLRVRLKPAKGAKGEAIANEAEGQFGQKGVALYPDTLASIHECLVEHEIAFATATARPRADGTRIDYEVRAWPIEHVRWDPILRCYMTRVDSVEGEETTGVGEVLIVHGDGRWIIFSRFEVDPFKHGAILAAAPVWARHAYAARDWAKSSVAHGNAKVLGSLPEGVPLQDADGNNTSEAEALAALLRAVATSDSPVGIKPAGATIDFIYNQSSAWQVFAELILNAEKSGARIYLGTDALMGAKENAPGMNVEALFGVARTFVQSDLACISRCLQTGLIEPWTALNFGDSSLAPERVYIFPDEDEEAVRVADSARATAFHAEIKAAKDNGFDITPAYVAEVAERHGVPAPALKPIAPAAPTNAPEQSAPPAPEAA
jgi:hypothetical protein